MVSGRRVRPSSNDAARRERGMTAPAPALPFVFLALRSVKLTTVYRSSPAIIMMMPMRFRRDRGRDNLQVLKATTKSCFVPWRKEIRSMMRRGLRNRLKCKNKMWLTVCSVRSFPHSADWRRPKDEDQVEAFLVVKQDGCPIFPPEHELQRGEHQNTRAPSRG